MTPEIHTQVMAERSQQLIREAEHYRLVKAATPAPEAKKDGESYLARLAAAARARRMCTA